MSDITNNFAAALPIAAPRLLIVTIIWLVVLTGKTEAQGPPRPALHARSSFGELHGGAVSSVQYNAEAAILAKLSCLVIGRETMARENVWNS